MKVINTLYISYMDEEKRRGKLSYEKALDYTKMTDLEITIFMFLITG